MDTQVGDLLMDKEVIRRQGTRSPGQRAYEAGFRIPEAAGKRKQAAKE